MMKVVCIGLLGVSLTACLQNQNVVASEQTVSIAVVDDATKALLPHVSCQLAADKGKNTVLTDNPSKVMLKTRQNSKVTLDCSAEGYYQKGLAYMGGMIVSTAADLVIQPGHVLNAQSVGGDFPETITVIMAKAKNPAVSDGEAYVNDMLTDNDDVFQGTITRE